MSLTNLEIQQLLCLCKSGDQQAQLEVYNRYYKAMYNTCFRIVGNSFEAEDIMQESFLTAFTRLNSLKDDKTFGGWLKRIVVNNSIQHYNKMKAKAETPIEEKLYKLKVEKPATQDVSEINRKAQMIINGIKALKDNYRTGLTLHLIEGYDYEEIGEIMGIGYGNCRTMISRAKESLRKQMLPLTNY